MVPKLRTSQTYHPMSRYITFIWHNTISRLYHIHIISHNFAIKSLSYQAMSPLHQTLGTHIAPISRYITPASRHISFISLHISHQVVFTPTGVTSISWHITSYHLDITSINITPHHIYISYPITSRSRYTSFI